MPGQPAPFLRRLAARVIDLLFALVVTFIIALPVAIVVALLTRCSATACGGASPPRSATSSPTSASRSSCCRDGQTLGKGLLGLRVVPADAETDLRAPPLVGQAAPRMLLIFLPFAFALAAGSAPGNQLLDALASVGFSPCSSAGSSLRCLLSVGRRCTTSSGAPALARQSGVASSGSRTSG